MDFIDALDPGLCGLDTRLARQALDHRATNHVGLELAVVGEEFFLFLVELAHNARRVGHAIETVFGEHFQEGTLFLDHQDFFQALGEVAHHAGLHGPEHAHLEDTDAVAAQGLVVHAQFEEGLTQVVVALAGRDDAQPGVAVLEHDVVELVVAHITFDDFQAAGVERLLHLQCRRAHIHAQVHVGREQLAVEFQVRGDEVQSRRVDMGGTGAIGNVGDDLHADPDTGQARHLVAMQAVVEDFLNVGWVQRGHANVVEHGLGLAAQRRALAAGVIARDGQDGTVLADTCVVGVFERVAAAVHARRLAVPHAGDAVEFLLAHGVQHLRAPHGRGSEVFVKAVNEVDVVAQQQFLLFDQRCVEHAHRGAPVAGNEHAGLEAAPCIRAHLVDREAHQRIDAAEVDFSGLLRERVDDILF